VGLVQLLVRSYMQPAVPLNLNQTTVASCCMGAYMQKVARSHMVVNL
jgi:hypothetical protein